MGESLGLRLCARWGRKCCLGFCGRGGMGEKIDFVGDGAAKVIEGLADVGGIVVSFVRILRSSDC